MLKIARGYLWGLLMGVALVVGWLVMDAVGWAGVVIYLTAMSVPFALHVAEL